jgi:hypothetical protein
VRWLGALLDTSERAVAQIGGLMMPPNPFGKTRFCGAAHRAASHLPAAFRGTAGFRLALAQRVELLVQALQEVFGDALVDIL